MFKAKKVLILICVVCLMVFLPGCNTVGDELEDWTYYNELDLREERIIEGDQIIFTLYENQAIPYRWQTSVSTSALSLVSEETVYGEGSMNEAGNSPAYHVFIYEWQQDGEAKIELIHARYGSDDRSEANVIRTFVAVKHGTDVECIEQ